MWKDGWPLWPLSLAGGQESQTQLSEGQAGGGDISDAINSLLPALSQSFAVILVGYASVKLNVVSTGHKQGLSLFVTRLALPALLFSGMASLDFSMINWFFLLAVTIGKTLVFFIAMGVTILLDLGKPQVLGTAGVHGIFVSQSNDFALGLPIFLPIFGKTHPEYISYLYLVAPISLVFLNPIGFLFMEAGRGMEEPDEQPKDIDLTCCEDVPEVDEEALGLIEGPGWNMQQRDQAGTYEPPQVSGEEEVIDGAIQGGEEFQKGTEEEQNFSSANALDIKLANGPASDASTARASTSGLDFGSEREMVEEKGIRRSLRGGASEVSLPEWIPVPHGDILGVAGPGEEVPQLWRVNVREGEGKEANGRGIEGRAGEFKAGLPTVPETWNRREFSGRPKAIEEEELPKGKSRMDVWKVLYSVVSSPVVFMVPVGLLANVIFHHNIPVYLSGPFETFGSAFSPLSLFILGMSMADQTESTGTEETLLGPLVVALALIVGKCLLLPLVITLVLINFNVSTSLVVAGLVYGALPVTPATFFFASEYGLCSAWIGMATVLGTFLFAPLVYVIVQLAFVVMNHYEAFSDQVVESAHTMSIIGAVGALWTLLALLRLRRREGPDVFEQHRRMEKSFVCCIGLSLLVCCLANLTCGLPIADGWHMVRYFALAGGDVAARIFTTIVAVSELCSTAMGPSVVHSRMWQILVTGWLSAAGATAIPVLVSWGPPKIDSDLMSCWFPYEAPQFYSFGIVNCICITLITVAICILVRDQFDGARLAGKSLLWSNVRLTWRPPPPFDASDVNPRPNEPSSQVTTPHALDLSEHQNVDNWPRLYPRTESATRREGWQPRQGDMPGRLGDSSSVRHGDWSSQPPSRQSSVRSRLSFKDAARGLLEGARGYAGQAGGAEALLGFNSRSTWQDASAVSRRWKQRTDLDEQNAMLLFCGYSVMAMLVSITLCIMALWNNCSWDKQTAQGALLLLLNTVLGFGQGAVLFLAYGLHPGLVEPLVTFREWWVEHRKAVFSEEEEPQERPKWTDVFAGEVDDCGPRYEKVWRRLGSVNVLTQDEWDRLPDDESIQGDSMLSRDLIEERVVVVTEDTLFETMPHESKGNKWV